MATKESDGVKVYTIDGTQYVGSLTNGLYRFSGSLGEGELKRYLAANALGELVKIEVGNNTSVITRQLTEDEALILQRVAGLWENAKKVADREEKQRVLRGAVRSFLG